MTELRVVGIATFPPVGQVGTDVPRLGTGALVTRDAYERMGGDRRNEPEFTAVRLADGTNPSTMTAQAFHDAAQTTTTWFTDAKPAEIRQLDAALPYLRGSLVVGYAALLAVAAHALWTRARANHDDLAVLRAVGCTRRQLDAVSAWQVAPGRTRRARRRDPDRRRRRALGVQRLRPVARCRRPRLDHADRSQRARRGRGRRAGDGRCRRRARRAADPRGHRRQGSVSASG